MSLQGSLFDWLHNIISSQLSATVASALRYLIILVATSYQSARPIVSTVHFKELVIN